MRKHHYFLVVLFLIVSNSQVFACSCKRFTVEQQVDNAQWVFTAKINKLELLKEKDSLGGGLIEIGFEQVDSIKGNVQKIVQLTTGTSTCGVDYEISRSYLIMADEYGSTNICTGTMQIVSNKNHPLFEEFQVFIGELKAFVAGELPAISAFFNPITKRTVNGPQKPLKSGCKQSGQRNE